MEWKIEQRKNGDVFVYAFAYARLLGFKFTLYRYILDPVFVDGNPTLKPAFLKGAFSNHESIEDAREAIEKYLDSIKVEKTYTVEIIEND